MHCLVEILLWNNCCGQAEEGGVHKEVSVELALPIFATKEAPFLLFSA